MIDKPRLLLHCCCAPCASYVLEYLAPSYNITALFYNPNIFPQDEYDKRAAELRKLAALAAYSDGVDVSIVDYDAAIFDDAASPFLHEPEGGRRCRICFEIRLAETLRLAIEGGFDVFATTLSVSPHKDAEMLNEIGDALAAESGVSYLRSDFKKRDGYKRSVELSKQYGLYRQAYCGCKPSLVIACNR